jgi:hypothetical protein
MIVGAVLGAIVGFGVALLLERITRGAGAGVASGHEMQTEPSLR